MSGYDDILILRIAGVGDTNGQYNYTTRPLPYSPPGPVYPILTSVPNALRNTVSLLDPVGSDSGITCSIAYSGAGAVELLSSIASPVRTSSGEVVRVAFPATDSELTIEVTGEPDHTINDPLWILGEAVDYDGYSAGAGSSGAGLMFVTRGLLGTKALPIPRTQSGIGPIVMTRWPTIVGARCTLSRVPANATSDAEESLIYTGAVVSVGIDNGAIEVRTTSALGLLRDAQYAPPKTDTSAAPVEVPLSVTQTTTGAQINGGGLARLARVPLDVYGVDPDAVTHVWILCEAMQGGGKVRILAPASGVYYNDDVPYVSIAYDAAVEQVWIDDRQLQEDQVGDVLTAEPYRIAGLQLADVIDVDDVADLFVTMLTGTDLAPMRGRLDASEIDSASFDVLTRAVNARPVSQLYSGATGYVVPYVKKPVTFRKMLAQMLAPLACGLAAGSDGKIRAIDYMPAFDAASFVTEQDTRSPVSAWTLDDSSAVRGVTLQWDDRGILSSRRITSDYASNVHAGGRMLSFELDSWIAPSWSRVFRRWQSLIAVYQRGAPVATFSVARGSGYEVGQVIGLRFSTLVGWDGNRYDTSTGRIVYGVITSAAPRISAPEIELTVTLVGWGTVRKDGPWGAAANIVSIGTDGSGNPTFTVGSDYTGTDDAAEFQVGEFLDVVSVDDLASLVTGTKPKITNITGSVITTTTFTSTASSGDVLISADRTTQPLVVVPTFGFAPVGGVYWAPANATPESPGPLAGYYTWS